MLLAIDIGNTNITLGIYEGERPGSRWRLFTNHERMPDEYGLQFLGMLEHAGLKPEDLSGICLASVVPPLTGKICQACRDYLSREPLVVDTGVKTGESDVPAARRITLLPWRRASSWGPRWHRKP